MTEASTQARRRRPRARPTLEDSMLERFRAELEASEQIVWPNDRYVNDPVGFGHEILGVVEIWDKQIEILESIRDNRNTTVRSGHKCGKTTALAIAALWFWATFVRARVLMTAVKAEQVDEVMWKEVRRLYRESKVPLGGTINILARSGLRHDDGRQVWGATARDGEGLAGISGPNILVLADEASGIRDPYFEVLGSSLAGSGGTVRKCYISNPTKTTGEFFRSHTTNKKQFHCIHISSEETPNALGTGEIPGLAGPVWIAERKAEYGEDSHAYRVRVKGEFVLDRDGKIISRDLITTAQEAWDETPEDGALQLGIDPAGDGIIGDETAIAVRRGNKILTVLAWRGLSEDDIVEHVAGLVATHRRTRDAVPRVTIDCEGGIGTRVMAKLRVRAKKDFEVVGVRSGKKLWGSAEFDTIRDGLWGYAQKWLLAGGALPEDLKLAEELNAPSFTADAKQRYVATPKKLLRKELGRSPDRADAVCLAIWDFQSASSAADEDDNSDGDDDLPLRTAARTSSSSDDDGGDDEFGGDVGRAFDPYGGAG